MTPTVSRLDSVVRTVRPVSAASLPKVSPKLAADQLVLSTKAPVPTGGVVPQGNFWLEFGKQTFVRGAVTQAVYSGVSSVVRNGLALVRKQVTPQRAVGNIAADVTLGAGKSVVAGTVSTLGTMGITALGLTAFPALLGTPALIASIALSMGTFWALGKVVDKLGWHQKISDKVTGAVGGKVEAEFKAAV